MQNSLNLRSANILFLIVIILILIFGSMMQFAVPLWGLVGTQIFLILVPTLIFLRVSKLPLRETIRWRWPGAHLAFTSILLGIAIIPFALWSGNFFIQLLDYTPDLHPGFFPTTIGKAILMFVGIAILAPLCEEVLFRGVIQRPYESFGPWAAILVVGFFFLIFHLSLLRLFALIPVALLLGYVVWASNSVISGVLAHAAYNAPVAVLTIIGSMRPDIPLEAYSSLPAAGIGLLGLIAGLILFKRYASPSPPPEVTTPSFTFSNAWPVFMIGLIFVFLASVEFLIGRFPELLVNRPLQLSSPPWEQPEKWQYELRNPLGESVGEAVCQLTPGETVYLLNCRMEVTAFRVELGRSYYQMDDMTSQSTFHWSTENLQLNQADIMREGDFGWMQAVAVSVEDQLQLEVQFNDGVVHQISIPPSSLLIDEYPWRLSALPFSVAYGSETTLVWPARWDEDLQKSVPGFKETTIIIRGGEPLATPAGNFISWRVTVGEGRIAWYDAEPPHTLLRYDDGILTYLLK